MLVKRFTALVIGHRRALERAKVLRLLVKYTRAADRLLLMRLLLLLPLHENPASPDPAAVNTIVFKKHISISFLKTTTYSSVSTVIRIHQGSYWKEATAVDLG